MLFQFFLAEMVVASKGNVLNGLARALLDLVKDCDTIGFDFCFRVDLHIMKSAAQSALPKLAQQVLPAFLDQLRSQSILLVNWQQLVFSPRPDPHSGDFTVDDRADVDI